MSQPEPARSDRSERPRRGPGRPRHADTEPRAYNAALEIFGRRGWAGLTLDGVASHAGIGKSSIYLRWRGKRELLLDALRDLQGKMPVPPPEDRSLRDELIAHATARAELFLGEYGPAMANLYAAIATAPEDFAEMVDEDIVRGLRARAPLVEDAVAGGELSPGLDIDALLDAIEGAVFLHVLVEDGVEGSTTDLAGYVADLVDLQLRGARS